MAKQSDNVPCRLYSGRPDVTPMQQARRGAASEAEPRSEAVVKAAHPRRVL